MNEGEVVSDASAVLALLMGEPFQLFAPERLENAVIGAVNLSEVLTRLLDIGMPEEEVARTLGRLDLHVLPFDQQLAKLAAGLRRTTRSAGLSLGDRACLALGLQLGRPVVTADRAWARVEVGVEVILIR